MKPLLVVTGLLLAIVVVLRIGTTAERPTPPPGANESARELRPVPRSQLADEEINRQDPAHGERERREARAFDRRPLLSALPATLHGITFDIAGLAADDRTTVIDADSRGVGRRRVRIAFETLLRRTDDRSHAYRLAVRP